jgi:hypothetical protein
MIVTVLWKIAQVKITRNGPMFICEVHVETASIPAAPSGPFQ